MKGVKAAFHQLKIMRFYKKRPNFSYVLFALLF